MTYSTENTLPSKDIPGLILMAAISAWIFLTTFLIQPIAWLAAEFIQISGSSWPKYGWAVISVVHAFLILLVTLPPALLWRRKRYRAIFQAWAVAAVYVLIMAFPRLVHPAAIQLANVAQIVFSFLFLLLFLILLRSKRGRLPTNLKVENVLLAFGLAGFVIFPWLAWGALGSVLDTLLNLLSGILFGLLAAAIVAYLPVQAVRQTNGKPIPDLLLTGYVTGILLLMLGAGFGTIGIQLLLMLALPAMGWVIAGVGYFGHELQEEVGPISLALLIGLATAAPMLLIDPDELTLILAALTRDILNWAISAASLSMLIALLLGIVMILFANQLPGRKSTKAVLAGSACLWLMAGLIYFLFGQPGFFGEELFVILKDKADLSGALAIENYDQRRQFVYDTLVEHAETSQAELRRDLDRFGIDYTAYYLVNGLNVKGGPLVRLWLSTRPDVDRILDNPILRPLPAEPAEAIGRAQAPAEVPWNLTLIGVDRVWQEFGVNGQGIVIGQSDSGVQGDHPELAAAYRGHGSTDDYNWYDPWYFTSHPVDTSGHGTHTLATIVGQQTGVAPGATWFGCVNLARNLANPALYLDCLQFMLAPYPQGSEPFHDGDPLQSAHVINNSWGCPEMEGCDPDSLLDAARALRVAGIFVVASAGNEGPACGTVQSPLALYDDAFSVGAIDSNGNLADFSSRGPVTVDGSNQVKPDIVAPGVDILSAYPGDSYEYLPGTSMAGPHVVGVVALIWSARPDLIGNIDQTEEILISTAKPYTGTPDGCSETSSMPGNGAGYGIVDAYAAVDRALSLR